MVKIQEAENQIVIDYEVYAERPSDSVLVLPAIETHEQRLGRVPRLVAGDAAFYFRAGQKWRTGCEGRISVLKRRHGLNRCRYKGDPGMKRWVGLGVIADNLINIGKVMAERT